MQLVCPSCGSTQTLHNPGLTVLVCDACDTTIFREGEVLRAGKESILGEPRSRLRVGASGEVDGRQITLLGRVRYRHPTGFWEEWYGQDASGDGLWLTEDEKQYALEETLDDPPDLAADVGVGHVFEHDGVRWQIDETGSATCDGVEGELPDAGEPGETYRYIDATEVNGSRQLTLEIAPDGEVDGYYGLDLSPKAVRFGDPGDDYDDEEEQASEIRCANCGSACALPQLPEPVVQITCEACDSVLDLSDAEARVVGKNARKRAFPIAIGKTGKLLGKEWECVGRTVYADREGWETTEYMLFNVEEGAYLWLEQDGGNWVYLRSTAVGPELRQLEGARRKRTIRIGNRNFKFFERGQSTLKYVDGALPWRARVGDGQKYYDLANPPHIFSVEVTKGPNGAEMERFVGQHLDYRDVYKAFGAKNPRKPSCPGAAAPNPITGFHWGLFLMFGFFGFLNFCIMVATVPDGSTLVTVSVPAGKGSAESKPFKFPSNADVMGVHTSAGVDNSWVWVETELLDADGEYSGGAAGSEVSYYHGYEGGESWSEGSKDTSRFFDAPPGGTYRISVWAEGEGEQAASVPVKVRVSHGDKLTRFPAILFFLMGLPPLLIFAIRQSFEKRRWEDD